MNNRALRHVVQLILVAALVAGGYLGYDWIANSKPKQKRVKPTIPIPMVRVVSAGVQNEVIHIHGQGTVKPWWEIKLVPQVAGKVVWASPSLVNGGAFTKGQTLVRIDQEDYRLAVTLAQARIKDAESNLQLVEQESLVARREWELLHPKDVKRGQSPPPLVVKIPQLAAAKAALEARKADLKKAQLNLRRTELTVPFDGRVSAKSVDVGQYVSPGQVLATLHSTEAVQIVVPLEDEDLGWFDVPGFTQKGGKGSPAAIHATVAGRNLTWQGRVDRSEGEVDKTTRTVRVVVRVDNPYATMPPLAPGLFVHVDISGKTVPDSVILPRVALREGNVIWVASSDGVLSFRNVKVARVAEDGVLVIEGLEQGELVVISPLNAPTDGMNVRLPVPSNGEKAPSEESSPQDDPEKPHAQREKRA